MLPASPVIALTCVNESVRRRRRARAEDDTALRLEIRNALNALGGAPQMAWWCVKLALSGRATPGRRMDMRIV